MTQTVVVDRHIAEKPDASAETAEEEVVDEPAVVPTKKPEKFIPLTRFAILDRLLRRENWTDEDFPHAERLFKYHAMWRHQEYCERLNRLNEAYMPFSPDRDTVRILQYTEAERDALQNRFVVNMKNLLIQGNYQRVTEEALDEYFTATSPYGLNLKVDLEEFEEVLVFCRGADTVRKSHRSWKKLYLGFEHFDVPIFQRLFLLLKLKPEERRVQEIMNQDDVSEKKARKRLNALRKNLPDEASSDFFYVKLFKQIPQSDLEMLFPNTRVDFKLLDKIKLGVTAGGGTIAGIAGTATKLLAALATFNLIAIIGGFIGLIALISRQVMKFFNQRTQYMMVLAQNLYFHNLANNRGVLTLMCDRAEEEDIKEEMLLYSYLCQYDVPRDSLESAKLAIEAYLSQEFGVTVDFDIEDALERLTRDMLVTERDGVLQSLRPGAAVAHLKTLWRGCLDLPSLEAT